MMNPNEVELTRQHNRELLQQSKNERLAEQSTKNRKARRTPFSTLHGILS